MGLGGIGLEENKYRKSLKSYYVSHYYLQIKDRGRSYVRDTPFPRYKTKDYVGFVDLLTVYLLS